MNKYERLSLERKELQAKGSLPGWYTTAAWQMFSEKYAEHPGQTFKDRIEVIANTLCKYWPNQKEAFDKFYQLMWQNILVPSSPVLANTGTNRGMSVSCSGSYIEDSVDGFYKTSHEVAMLSKNGFGTSACLDGISPQGTITSSGCVAAGPLPVFKMLNQVAADVSQGGVRRGAIACYIAIDHPDWDSIIDSIKEDGSDGVNVGWNISNAFIDKLNQGDLEATRRYQKALAFKMRKGKGYFFFPDKANELMPQCFKDRGLTIKASNLCVEISLPSDKDHTFTCVLSSLNLAHPLALHPDSIEWSINFLHCVAVDFLHKAMDKPGLERAVRFTQKAMALGLGTLGYHTAIQQAMVPFESMVAYQWNQQVFSTIKEHAENASRKIAHWFGEPEWCKGTGRAHSTLIAVAPNMSSALLAGGVSQGIEPIFSNTFIQDTAAGEVERINPVLLELLNKRGLDVQACVKEVIDADGSVQGVDWLNSYEKEVFKTAFEIDQSVIINKAAARQRFIDQGQSINLFFDSEAPEEYVSRVHQLAFNNSHTKGLYYVRSKSGIIASTGESCVMCAS